MAWQSSAGIVGSGGATGGGNEAGNNGSQQQGTEYTLQGQSMAVSADQEGMRPR